jgi:hypothetical protein
MTLPPLTAQQSNTGGNVSVPHLIRYGGVLKEVAGRQPQGKAEITFAFYKDEQGGEPLWLETQEVTLDATGGYSVMLGATTGDGLPQSLFQAGDAWWIEARAAGAATPARSLLAAVPYALKSVDAETLAGRAAADYVTRDDLHREVVSAGVQAAPQANGHVHPMTGLTAVTGGGTAGFVPVWTGAATLGNSVIAESGTKVGIGITAPTTTLDVNGGSTLRGLVALPAPTLATAAAGVSSPALKFSASSFSSTTAAAIAQNFAWEAVSVGNNTASPTSSLQFRFSTGTLPATSTGLQIAPNGQITFAAGQTFPGTGKGTITGVTPGLGITGGGASGSVSLGIDPTKVPQLNTANTFTGNQTVVGNLSSNGQVSGATVNALASFNLGGNPFAFGSINTASSYFGFAGNQTSTGGDNMGVGQNALHNMTNGNGDTAAGAVALLSNTSGSNNSAFGNSALTSNTTGGSNSAVGDHALFQNVGGSSNTALGAYAGPDASHSGIVNATAIGANAQVTTNNALVLGSIKGVNGATADTQVGIGTTAPAAKLDVHGTANFTGLVTFASGQTFPGTSTISAVNTGTGLTGGGTTGALTLKLDTDFTDGRYPLLAANNAYSGVQLFNNSVGIGVSSPSYPLHVMGTIRSESGGVSLGGFAPLVIDAFGVPGGRMIVNSNGNVGIDNPNPNATVDVGGSINSSGAISGASLTVGGAVSAGSSLTIAGDQPMTAAPHMYLTGYVPGPLPALSVAHAIFTIPSKPILITRLTSVGVNTCPNSGPLTFSIFTSENGFLGSIDLGSQNLVASDSGPIAVSIAAGTHLFGLINTPDCGQFGTAPTNLPVTMEYVMQ